MAARGARAWRILRTRGVPGVLAVLLGRALAFLERRGHGPRTHVQMLVRYDDALAADWSREPRWRTAPRQVGPGALRTAWIMHPPGESSGGHQNIFRFISYLEAAGHSATVHLYDARDQAVDAQRIRQLLLASPSYPSIAAPFTEYRGVPADTDVIVATGWETAYPAFLDPSDARRLYFVQDYEPSFYPVGSEHTLAENTYRFGFPAITAGRWLAHKLEHEYGMRTAWYDFAADTGTYHVTNTGRREDVFFYARPVTTRRGFELGVMALQQLARIRPGVTIHMAGWDVSGHDLPFPYVNHGSMKVSELNDLYNRCAVGLVLSLTNLSLLPLELLAAGVIPVLNDAENNRMVTDNPHIRYAPPSPAALARAMNEVLEQPDLPEVAVAAAAGVREDGWDRSGRQFLAALESYARG